MFYSAGGVRLAVLTLACLGAFSCARRSAPSHPPRVAFLRFENLGPDPSQDWMGRAFAEVLADDLSHARDLTIIHAARIHTLDGALGPRPVSAPGISSERLAAIAAGAGLVGYGTYTTEGGRLRATLDIEDVNTRRMVYSLSANGAAGDVIGVGSRLASAVSPQAAAFVTSNEEALRDYSQAMEIGASPQSRPLLQQAIASDPNFGPAYRILSQLELQQQDRSASMATLEQALSRGDAISGVERARLAVDLAGLQNQPQLKMRALDALVKLEPGDISAWEALAALAMARRQYAESVHAYRSLLEREPEDFNAWNGLSYSAANAGDYQTARDAARHYAALRPNDLNPIDSLGDVNLISGRFREAEEAYLAAAKRDPNFSNNGEFFKAAMARLWTGDIAGANTLAARYHEARVRAHDPLVDLRRIEWTWLTGQRKEACRQAEALARASQGELATRVWAELAVWELMLGDRTAAQAAAQAIGTNAGAISLMVGFLTQPPASAEEWNRRSAQVFASPQLAGVRSAALTGALLLSNQFREAAALLERSVEGSGAKPDETASVLLAWAYIESGRQAEAEPLLRTFPAPSFNGPDAFLSFSFPRFYYLRGEDAARRGKADEARAAYRLFLQLSGPDALQWGEEQKAKAAL